MNVRILSRDVGNRRNEQIFPNPQIQYLRFKKKLTVGLRADQRCRSKSVNLKVKGMRQRLGGGDGGGARAHAASREERRTAGKCLKEKPRKRPPFGERK